MTLRKSVFAGLAGLILIAFATPLLAEEPPLVIDPYGYVRFETFYDDAQVVQGDWLLLAPADGSAAADEAIFSITARHTRFGVNLGRAAAEDGPLVLANVEVDFAGGFPNSSTAQRQPILRLRHAWFAVQQGDWELLMGQTWAPHSAPFPNTAVFTAGAAMGNLWMRLPQIRLSYMKQNFSASAAVARPLAANQKYNAFANSDLDFIGDGERSGLPWFLGHVRYKAGPVVVAGFGHYGMEDVADTSGLQHDVGSWAGGGSVTFTQGPLRVRGKGWTGENLNTFFGGVIQGIVVGASDVTPVASFGGWADATWKFSETVATTVGFGMDDPDEADLGAGARTDNTWLWANLELKPWPDTRFLCEVDHVTTGYVGGTEGSVLRLMVMGQYFF